MFIDEASIIAIGGDGGDGCSSFRREKFVPRGGPDGGDGGHGGSVILEASRNTATLLEFRRRGQFRADRGRHGQGSDKTGRSGEDRIVRVPVGTVVLDEDGTRRIADLVSHGQRFVAARGGRGGRGNARFSSSRQRAPTRRELGEAGQETKLRLELKLLADVGLLGFPNAGKSTLISRISAAHPRIADYPFTTLEPHLGVVECGEYRSFVVADIPGLIEGAHHGAGLGHRFLRHVERCRMLLHLVDMSDVTREPVEAIHALDEELRRYRHDLSGKPQILVMTKADASQDALREKEVRRFAEERGLPCLLISAVTGQGLDELVRLTATRLEEIGEPRPDEDSHTAERVGVLGGTFDPIHCGHLEIAERVRERLGIERVLLVPAALPPHKDADGLAPARDREEMVRLAIRDRPGLELSSVECDTGEVNYTLETLRRLRGGHPSLAPVFVLGMDALAGIVSWRNWSDLLEEFDLVVIDRPGDGASRLHERLDPRVAGRVIPIPATAREIERMQLGRGGRILHLVTEPIAISSSEIRSRASSGAPLEPLVPPAVAGYIRKVGLYRTEEAR